MTFVLHLFGHELFRVTLGRVTVEEEEAEYVDNTGGDFELPFGFGASPALAEDDEEDEL